MRRPGRRSPAAGAAVAGRGDEGRAARGEPRVEEGLPRARRAGGGGRRRRHVARRGWSVAAADNVRLHPDVVRRREEERI